MRLMEKTFSENKLFVVDEKVRTKDPEVINEQYRKKIKEGLEGVMVKKVDAEFLITMNKETWKYESVQNISLDDFNFLNTSGEKYALY